MATTQTSRGIRSILPNLEGNGLFLFLKVISLALITFYSFEIIYVLVRTVPRGFYPSMVFLSSIGGYVIATDLGFSSYVYSVVRQGFVIGEDIGADELVSEAWSLYLLIALSASCVAGIVVSLTVAQEMKIGLIVYFASIVVSLPWMLVRRAAAAVDMFLEIEAIECARRALMCILAATMLDGLPLSDFSGLALVSWAAVFASAKAILHRHGLKLSLCHPYRLVSFYVRNRSGITKSARLTGLEFLLYNVPYVCIPLVFGGPANIVPFDVFNKVARFSGAICAVPGEAFCALQTKAHYSSDRAGVQRYQRLIWLIAFGPLSVAALLLLVAGGPVIERLLAGTQTIGFAERLAMAAMLGVILLQTSAGGFLLDIGQFDSVALNATLTMILLIALLAAAIALQLSFPTFMLLYVGIHFVHAALYQAVFRREAGRPEHAGHKYARPSDTPDR